MVAGIFRPQDDSVRLNEAKSWRVRTSDVSGKRRFSVKILAAIRERKGVRIRAGDGPHRFIGIWAVVGEDRVFVRSWSLKAKGWWRTFLTCPRGAIEVGGREIQIRAVFTKSERLKDAIDEAYLAKYNTPGSLKYGRDLGRGKSRATTTELVPRS